MTAQVALHLRSEAHLPEQHSAMVPHVSLLFLHVLASVDASKTPELVAPDELVAPPDDDDELEPPLELPPDDALELLALATGSSRPSCKPDWSTSIEHAPAKQAIATMAERRIPIPLERTRRSGGGAPPRAPTGAFSWSYGGLGAVRWGPR